MNPKVDGGTLVGKAQQTAERERVAKHVTQKQVGQQRAAAEPGERQVAAASTCESDFSVAVNSTP